MTFDPLLSTLIFLAVTGMVLALTSLSGPTASRVRVRILSPAGEGPLAPASGPIRLPADGDDQRSAITRRSPGPPPR